MRNDYVTRMVLWTRTGLCPAPETDRLGRQGGDGARFVVLEGRPAGLGAAVSLAPRIVNTRWEDVGRENQKSLFDVSPGLRDKGRVMGRGLFCDRLNSPVGQHA